MGYCFVFSGPVPFGWDTWVELNITWVELNITWVELNICQLLARLKNFRSYTRRNVLYTCMYSFTIHV